MAAPVHLQTNIWLSEIFFSSYVDAFFRGHLSAKLIKR